jgi:glycosyltransferase involved in cell wall biosynthesis
VIYRSGPMALRLRTKPRAALVHARSLAGRVAAPVGTELAWLSSRRSGVDLAVFHELAPPPTGGGHQFLRALLGELRRRGLAVELNRISGGTPACLFNSFNFDFRRLHRFARGGVRMVHRVDGPIGVYRGFDDGTDAAIVRINRELADATVFQSEYSLAKHRELGFELANPVIIRNSVDPAIFHPPASREPLAGRRVRVIASSWSDNPRKGADILSWLDRNLDFERYAVTFAGRTQATFRRIQVVGPLPSDALAALLRAQDVYVATSRDDPCSNALLEALACGLPAAFLRSGGHPELVGDGGLPFDDAEELPAVLARLQEELEERRAAIHVPPLADVADRYLEVLRG